MSKELAQPGHVGLMSFVGKVSRPSRWHCVRGLRRCWQGEAGMVTAETAVVLPAIALVLLLVLNGVAAGVVHLRVTDCARVTARAAAIGEKDLAAVAGRAAPGIDIAVEHGELTCVTAVRAVPGPLGRMGLEVRSRACAYTEPGERA